MIIENPSAEIIGSEGLFEDIERAARVCYASSPKGNAEEFVDRLVKKQHGRPLEFGTVRLIIPDTVDYKRQLDVLKRNRYTKCYIENGMVYVTTNYRVLVQNGFENLLDLTWIYCIAGNEEKFEDRKTVRWNISRGIADEFRTHTMISSLMRSTRYCNYSKDKFGHQVTFIRPQWFNNTQAKWRRRIMKVAWWMSEKFYMLLIKMGCTAQEARDVLPLAIKAEFIQCAFEEDWDNFFKLRCDKAAHPDARFIANKVKHGFR